MIKNVNNFFWSYEIFVVLLHSNKNLSIMTTLKTIENLRLKANALWTKACEFDGIDPKSKFVTFSNSNPFEKEYNDIAIKLMEARAKAGMSTL